VVSRIGIVHELLDFNTNLKCPGEHEPAVSTKSQINKNAGRRVSTRSNVEDDNIKFIHQHKSRETALPNY